MLSCDNGSLRIWVFFLNFQRIPGKANRLLIEFLGQCSPVNLYVTVPGALQKIVYLYVMNDNI